MIGLNTNKKIVNKIKNNILLYNKLNIKLNIFNKKCFFLGYLIFFKKCKNLLFKAPIDKIIIKLFLNGYCKKKGKPTFCGKFIHKSLYEIIMNYLILQQKLCNYYFIAINYNQFVNRIHYILKYSCAFTFTLKLKLKKIKKIWKKFGKNLTIFLNKKQFVKIFFLKPKKNFKT